MELLKEENYTRIQWFSLDSRVITFYIDYVLQKGDGRREGFDWKRNPRTSIWKDAKFLTKFWTTSPKGSIST